MGREYKVMEYKVMEYKVIREWRRPEGRTTIEIECPFCREVAEAYKWSLYGSGKRCSCGAKHTGMHGTIAPKG